LKRLPPHLVLADLNVADVLAETHQRIVKVYFPHTRNHLVRAEGPIETGIIGNDGNFGAARRSMSRSRSITSSSRFPAMRRSLHSSGFAIADELPVFRGLLIKLINSFPSPADGRLQRRAQARTCKWLHANA
jgi:hypothetical protein